MPLYEHVFLARPDISTQQVDTLVETYKGVVSENGGSVAKTEYWGLKSLPYRIKKNRKAHYVLMNITAPSGAVAEMERLMSISEDVLRFITIRVEELEEGPSAMMRRDERRDDRRDDRRGGGGRFRDGGERGERGERGPRRGRDDDERAGGLSADGREGD